jgi:O-antigen/teichoic acid export membrane protein
MSEEAGRLIMRGAQATALGSAVRIVARLLFLFLAARWFGTATFGAYLLAVAAIELAVTLAALGTKKTIFQILGQENEQQGRPAPHRLLDAALLVALAGLALAAIIAAAAVALPSHILAPATATALLLLAPMAAGQALLDLFLAATRWKHAIRYEVVARSVVEPWALLAGIAAAWLIGWRETGLVLGYYCGTLAALGYSLWGARRRFGGLRLRNWRPRRRDLAVALSGAPSNCAVDFLNALYGRADLYLVGILLGEAGAGIYGMARQIVAPLRQVRQSFDGLLIPLVAHSLSARGARATGEALASATRLVLVLQLPLLLLLLILGEPLLRWLGSAFPAGFWALLALAVAETIQTALSVGDLVFVYLRPRLGLWLTLASIVAGLAAALLLIPALGLTGAGLSVLLSYSLRALLRSWLLRAVFDVAIPRAHVAGPLAAATLAALAGVSAAPLLSPVYAFGLSLALYAAAILLWASSGRHGLRLSGLTVPAVSARQEPSG